MLHWITDQYLVSGETWHGGTPYIPWMMFHFLRVLGWNIRGEVDHVQWKTSGHIPDGSMDADNVTNWSVVGTATRAKSTLVVHDGYRSLTFTTAATGDGVQSATFVNMEASVIYSVGLWAYNNCGHQLKVYIDTGTGSWTLLGTIAHNAGSWTFCRWTYTSHSSVSVCKLKIVDEDGTVSTGQVYIDSVYTALSQHWEDGAIAKGTDGVIESSNNKFSSASYSFTDTDITNGRFVCFSDFTNAGNSGIYPVVGRDGTKAVLGLRDDGSNYLVANTGLTFRVVSRESFPWWYGGSRGACGVCIESPNSPNWRIKMRTHWAHWSSYVYQLFTRFASAPGPCGLNVDNFQFYKDARSTSRNLIGDANVNYDSYLNPGTIDSYMTGVGQRQQGSTSNRFTLVTDVDNFVLGVNRGPYPSAFFIGFLGSDVLTVADTFAHLQRYPGDSSQQQTELRFDSQTYSWGYYGSNFGKSNLALQSCIASAGYGTSTSLTEGMTNAKANPISGEESIRPLMIFSDWPGSYGEFKTVESTNEAFGHCRKNIAAWTTFGASREWLHLYDGLCMAWHGRQVIP